MTNATTNRPLHVSTFNTEGPHLWLPLSQLDDLRQLLDRHGVTYWVGEDVIMSNGALPDVVVRFGRGGDAGLIQAILDNVQRASETPNNGEAAAGGILAKSENWGDKTKADATTQKTLHVSNIGTARPYMRLPLDKLDDLRQLLDCWGIFYWESENDIAIDGTPATAVVKLGCEDDAATFQAILDNMSSPCQRQRDRYSM